MELKHFLSDINDLRIHESNKDLSEWGKDKLKEYEFILTELTELKKLRVADVSKRKFAVEWMRNVNYGIGSGTEYFYAETREEALRLFWNGKNKEAFDVNTIYVC